MAKPPSVSITDNVEEVRRWATNAERRQIPFALARALTWTAKDAQKDVKKHMSSIFDRPTRYTLNSLRTKPATKKDLTSAVFFREFAGKGTPAYKYLTPHILGGSRRQKSSERQLQPLMGNNGFWVPGAGVKLNTSGNVRGSDITRILSRVGRSTDAGQNQTAGSKRRGGRRKQYFVPRPGSALRPAVYERIGKRKVMPVLVFVSKVTYQKRFMFKETIEATVFRKFDMNFKRSFDLAMATAR